MLLLGAGVAAVVALCVAAILLAGSRPQVASREFGAEGDARSTAPDRKPEKERAPAKKPVMQTEEEALAAEAREYAKAMGVSQEEAMRRLEMQGDPFLARLDRELRQNERDTYAELRLRHKPDYGITLAFTGDPHAAMEKVEPLVEGTQWEGTVKIDHVELTMTELHAVRAEAERVLDRIGIRYDSDENLSASHVQIYVADKDKLRRELRASGLELPEHTIVMEGLSVPMDGQ